MKSQKFEKRLAISHGPVWLIAISFWEQKGYEVKIPAQMDKPDDGDLFVRHEDWDEWKRVEVKQRGWDFECKRTIPFNPIWICDQNSFDNAKVRPWVYFILNRTMTHAIIINVEKSFSEWTIAENCVDKGYQTHNNYQIRKESHCFRVAPMGETR